MLTRVFSPDNLLGPGEQLIQSISVTSLKLLNHLVEHCWQIIEEVAVTELQWCDIVASRQCTHMASQSDDWTSHSVGE